MGLTDPCSWVDKRQAQLVQRSIMNRYIKRDAMIWKNSYDKGMPNTTFRRKTKKATILNEWTKRGRKVVMSRADQNDRT